MPETTTTILVLRLAGLFERLAWSMTTEPLEQQWYWPKIQRILAAADSGANGRYVLENLFRELGV